MDVWQQPLARAREIGLAEPLSEHVALLAEMLEQAVRAHAGRDVAELIDALNRCCWRAEDEGPHRYDEVQEQLRGLDRTRIAWLLRAYTAFFHLVNEAEKQEIVRINRQRASRNPQAPRPESITEAIARLKEQGFTLGEVTELLGRLDIQPTLTAHPTEARRRTVLHKQRHVTELLAALQRPDATPDERADALDDLRRQIALLLATEEVRAEQPTVEVEVKQGLYFMRDAIWRSVPDIHRDVERALQRYYGDAVDAPAFVRYRSWIGGDRDGNPNVTAAVTRWTLATQRRTALELYLEELHALRRELSLSERQVPVPRELHRSNEADLRALRLDGAVRARFRHQPYRLKIACMMAKLERALNAVEQGPGARGSDAYGSAGFLDDLTLVRRCLEASGFGDVARGGRLGRLLSLVRTFGFHLAALDIREHSAVHEDAVAALLRAAGVHEDYAALSEREKQELLGTELANPRPLLPRGVEVPAEAAGTLETLEVVRDAVAVEPDAVGGYVVSMTHGVSDLLEVMLLAKEVGLWRREDARVSCPMDLIPLFETIEDLGAVEERLESILTDPVYREQLAARGRFQEVMIGYSDSNKDGGYWMANWVLHQAQDGIARVCARHGVDLRLFHGRGGTVERGGGRAHRAILAVPPNVHNGRIRFTEQGEVISFRYASAALAKRHLEQVVNAVMDATARRQRADDAAAPAHIDLMEPIARRAMEAYRGLIDGEAFWHWYTRVTPIRQISRLPIASRPVSRKASEVDFEGLRAIPWVFAWTQTRYTVPGWFGVGAALREPMRDPAQVEVLRGWYRDWPFFRALIDNAQREMVRARLKIAQRYAALAADGEDDFHPVIAADFESAREAILAITGNAELLGHNPVIQGTIRFRNPYTDVLNLLQIELMRRYDASAPDEREALRQALFLSINGIAAAMQSTG